jgi:hypothetical protein
MGIVMVPLCQMGIKPIEKSHAIGRGMDHKNVSGELVLSYYLESALPPPCILLTSPPYYLVYHLNDIFFISKLFRVCLVDMELYSLTRLDLDPTASTASSSSPLPISYNKPLPIPTPSMAITITGPTGTVSPPGSRAASPTRRHLVPSSSPPGATISLMSAPSVAAVAAAAGAPSLARLASNTVLPSAGPVSTTATTGPAPANGAVVMASSTSSSSLTPSYLRTVSALPYSDLPPSFRAIQHLPIMTDLGNIIEMPGLCERVEMKVDCQTACSGEIAEGTLYITVGWLRFHSASISLLIGLISFGLN